LLYTHKNKGSLFASMVSQRTLNIFGTFSKAQKKFFILEKGPLDYKMFFTLRKKMVLLIRVHWKVVIIWL